MSKYQDPFSTDKRNTVFIDVNDPRAQGWKLGQTESRIGREVEVVGQNSKSLTLSKYVAPIPAGPYWFAYLYKLGITEKYGYYDSGVVQNSIYSVGVDYRLLTTNSVNGIFSFYDKDRNLLSQKKFYRSDVSTSIRPRKIQRLSNGEYITFGSTGNYTTTDGFSYSSDNLKLYVSKHSADMSSVLWSKIIDTSVEFSKDILGMSLITDSSDNIYLCGSKRMVVPYMSSSTRTESAICVVKYSSSGILQWQKAISHNSVSGDANSLGISSSDIKIDSSGNLYILASQIYDSYDAIDSPFLIKINPTDGSIIWQKKYIRQPGGMSQFSYGMAVDSDNNIYMLSHHYFGQGGLSLIKVNSSGVVIWAKNNSSFSPFVSGYNRFKICVDLQKNVYLSASESDGALGQGNVILFKFDESGTFKWSNYCYVTYGVLDSYSININQSGDIYFSGTANGTPYVVKLPSDGSLTGTSTNAPNPSGNFYFNYQPWTYSSFASDTTTDANSSLLLIENDFVETNITIVSEDSTLDPYGAKII